ncbi:MAG: hypothetical protein ACJ8F1_20575 [Polyangia bacterium]
MTAALGVLALLLAGTLAASPADEDADLARIPDSPATTGAVPPVNLAPAAAPIAHAAGHGRLYLEDALTLAARRTPVVPFPPPPPYAWQNRASADLVAEWLAGRMVKLVLSDRVDVVAQQDVAWSLRSTIRNELREAYASWNPRAGLYLEAGRINVRNGVALGFNPTDVFRPRTLVGQASLDPSVLSRNRLGTLMLRAQAIGERGAVSIVYAPMLFEPSAVTADRSGVNPRFDATNAAHRVLASAGGNAGDVSVQGMAYFEPHRSKVGLALTRPVGPSVVAYVEWTLGHEAPLTARAIEDGRQTGAIPADAPPPLPIDPALGWRNDLAAGGSWTIGTRLTLNAEYHFHQGALTESDWTHWFAAGRASPQAAPELWYIRGYAADQLEPASQHNAFVRLAWPNAGLADLELDGFAFINLRDGSILTQTSAIYTLSDRWTLTLSFGATIGSAESERGSLPQAGSIIAELVAYL